MKPIIFVRVADMTYYQGITDSDQPYNGGSHVMETGRAHECYNFAPVVQDGEDFEKCLGYFQANGNNVCQLHIEKTVGCEGMKKTDQIDGVTVVFVSKAKNAMSLRVAGFYKNATVYRYPHTMEFENGYLQSYWFEARKEDCVVLPRNIRLSDHKWYVPASTEKSERFGLGRSGLWYAGKKGSSEEEKQYAERMWNATDSYIGDNLIEWGGAQQ